MGGTLTFSPDSVALVFGGYQVEGWNSIRITRSSPMVVQRRGIRGKHAKEFITDTSCIITLAVPQAMEVNTILSEVLKLEERTQGKARLEVMLKDNSGGSVFTSVECYLSGYPEVGYSASLSELEWEFICDSSEWTITGTEANRNALTDMVSGALGSVTDAVGGLFS